MTNKEAISTLELLKIFDAPNLCEAVKMAIAALRAQQEPLDRSRWEVCEYCKDEPSLYIEGGYRYCPHCGRPLTEEAWAELERRIGGNDGIN